MTKDRKINRKIYAFILTAALVYGAFFSVMADIAFAEDTAQDETTKIEKVEKDADKSGPDPSDPPASKGDTSGSSSGTEVGNSTPSSDQETITETPTGTTPGSSDRFREVGEGEPEGDSVKPGGSDVNLGGDGTGTGKDGTGAEKPASGDESQAKKAKVTVVNWGKESTHDVDEEGTVRVSNFFHTFDKGAYGIELMILFVDEKYYPIIHYSTGHLFGFLPTGFYKDNGDLVIEGLAEDAYVFVLDHYLASSIGTAPDSESSYTPPVAYSEPQKSAGGPAGDTDIIVEDTPDVLADAPKYAALSDLSIPEDAVDDKAISNAVLSSYKNLSDNAVFDATNDNDGPINATTAMMAGVGAMFMITLALVVVPKI